MNTLVDVEEDFIASIEKKIDIVPILLKYLSNWKWFVKSIIICLAIAVAFIYFTLPTYLVSTSILFKDDHKGSTSELNMTRDMGVVTRRNNADNEVEIMKKSLIAETVVKKLDLYTTYFNMSSFLNLNKIMPSFPMRKTDVLYGDELPVKIVIPDDNFNFLLKNDVTFYLTVYPNGSYTLSGKYKNEKFEVNGSPDDSIVQMPFGQLKVLKGDWVPHEEMQIEVLLQHPLNVADGFLESLAITLTSKNSSVADITLNVQNAQLGKDFLTEYVKTYNEIGIQDQLDLAEKTSQIIDKHLSDLSNELSSVEDQAQEFRQSRGLTDIASQADLYNSQLASVSQRKIDIESQYRIISEMLALVQENSSHNQLIPANSGVQSVVLNSHINTYNELVQERIRLAKIASSSNQSMIDLTNRVETTYRSVVSGLQREKSNIEIQLKDLNAEVWRNSERIRAIPQQERAYSDIKRQQNIKEDLFLYLLQKKEERYMNMTAVEPNSRLIDNVRVMGVVWPKKMIILCLSILFGLVLPIIVIHARDLLRYQLDSKEELAKISSIPLLGEIPRTPSAQAVMVKKDGHDSFNELMRLLRANLLFVIDDKEKNVINVLSSISGEGKSFVSLNLSMSLVFLNKRVLLIDLDIRKPKLAKNLGFDNKEGITLYLSGSQDKKDLVRPSGLHPNLFVITSGPIPPNPNELLAKTELDDFINEVRKEYDFIIVDTAPVGLVSDGFLLDRIADVNLYVTRVGYTPKRYLEEADRYFHENRIKKMYFVLNDIDLNAVSYRYMYKKNGYGYA